MKETPLTVLYREKLCYRFQRCQECTSALFIGNCIVVTCYIYQSTRFQKNPHHSLSALVVTNLIFHCPSNNYLTMKATSSKFSHDICVWKFTLALTKDSRTFQFRQKVFQDLLGACQCLNTKTNRSDSLYIHSVLQCTSTPSEETCKNA